MLGGFFQRKADLEKGITTVQKTGAENLDMKLYLKLIIQKFRMAIILRYAPKLESSMSGDLSEEDLKFLKETKDKEMFNSVNLATLLEAYQNIDRAFVSELPLELALVKILGKD